MTIHPLKLAGAGALLLSVSAAAQDAPPGEDAANVIAVHGDIPHCHRRPGDPLDLVDVRHPQSRGNQVVLADARGRYRMVSDFDPLTGPSIWQRAGTGIDDYVFRVPTDDSPMCMGSHGAADRSFSQLRRVIDAAPLRGKYVRFTAFVATRQWNIAKAWLAAVPDKDSHILQGDQESQEIQGTGKWEPMSITMGPIPVTADKVSYGFLLQYKGDLWILQPRIEVLDRKPADVVGRRTD